MRLPLLAVVLLSTSLTPGARSDTRVNPDSQIVGEFLKRVAGYEQLRKSLDSKLPALKSTDSPVAIDKHEHELAEAIRKQRRGVQPGEIFTPQITGEFRRLIGMAMQGQDAARVRKSLQDSEPIAFPVKVNELYPAGVPQQSTPPTLLMNLPGLPMNLQYRLVGSTLILLDAGANLIVDLMPNAFS